MAMDIYLKIDTVDGESTAKGLEKQIEIISFSWGASNPSTVGTGSGGSGAGRVSISSFNIMKRSDIASSRLFQVCCTGDHFPKAKVTMRKVSGQGSFLDFLVYEFEEVFVDSIQWSASSGGDDVPMESVSFSFAKIKSTYRPQKKDGTGGSPIDASWDVTTRSK